MFRVHVFISLSASAHSCFGNQDKTFLLSDITNACSCLAYRHSRVITACTCSSWAACGAVLKSIRACNAFSSLIEIEPINASRASIRVTWGICTIWYWSAFYNSTRFNVNECLIFFTFSARLLGAFKTILAPELLTGSAADLRGSDYAPSLVIFWSEEVPCCAIVTLRTGCAIQALGTKIQSAVLAQHILVHKPFLKTLLFIEAAQTNSNCNGCKNDWY